jgi:hypothetical protein
VPATGEAQGQGVTTSRLVAFPVNRTSSGAIGPAGGLAGPDSTPALPTRLDDGAVVELERRKCFGQSSDQPVRWSRCHGTSVACTVGTFMSISAFSTRQHGCGPDEADIAAVELDGHGPDNPLRVVL